MEHVILVRYGEIALKGLNRNYFIDLLAKNIRNTLGCAIRQGEKDSGTDYC